MALNSDQLAAAEPNEKYQQTQHDRCRSRGTKIGAGKNGGPKLTDSPPLSRVEQGAGTDRPASSAPSVEGAVAKPRESRRDLDLSRTSETVATLFGSADEPFCALRPPLTSDGAHDDAEVVVRCPHTLELFPDEEADDDWSPSIHCLAVKSASSCDLPHSQRLASRIGQ